MRTLLTTLLICAFALAAMGQSPNTATIVVDVTDATGAVIPDATVSIVNAMTGDVRHATSAGSGDATIPGLALTGTYRVTVDKAGFASETIDGVALRAGETAELKVKLMTTGAHSEVTVYGTTAGVQSGPEAGTRLDSERIDETPILGRKISSVPLLSGAFRNAKGTGDLFMNSVYFVSGAGGRRQADFVVDGATADEPWGRQTMFTTIPLGAVQEMNVMPRAFSPEFGWTASPAINMVTKAGSNVVHGEALVLERPGGAQAKQFSTAHQCPGSIASCVAPTTPIITPDIPDELSQGSFSIGGPLVKDRTYYFVAADATFQDRTAAITSPLVVVAPATFVPYKGQYRQALIDARGDHKLNAGNSLMLRLNLDRFYDTNPQDAVAGNVLSSAGRRFSRHAYGAQLNETAVLSASMLNEARFVYQNANPVTAFDPLTPSTQFTRAGSVPFTSGESRATHIFSHQSEFRDTLSWTRGSHYLRMGGSLARHTSGGDGTEFGSAYTLGQFTVNSATTAPVSQLTLADMTRYTQSFNLGQGTYVQSQWIYAAFIQDSYRAGHDLTLDFGLRYDRQTFSDGKKNFAPRAGFGWNPWGDSRTSVRGGFGVYYTQMRANNAPNFTLGGPQGVFTYTATPGQTGFPTCLTCTPVNYNQNAAAGTLPARNITIRPGMAAAYAPFFDVSRLPGYAAATFVNPKSRVGSIGIERQFVPRLFLSADYVKQHWTGLDQTVDLNAPSLFVRTAPGQVRTAAAADATRPIVPVNGGYRTINVVENLGVGDYNGLQTMLRWQSTRVFLSLSYTLSKATNTTEPDGNGAGQNDFNQLGAAFENAPSLLDQRHRGVVSLSYRMPWNLTAGTVAQTASAKPFNPTTGTDNNGDGNNNDRPVIAGQVAGRYSFRGTPTSDVSAFVEKRISLAERSLLLRAECFNLLNYANVLARNGTYGDSGTPLPTFGTASPGLASIDPSRMIQLQIRFVW